MESPCLQEVQTVARGVDEGIDTKKESEKGEKSTSWVD